MEVVKRAIDGLNNRRDLLALPDQTKAALYKEIFTPDAEFFPGLTGTIEGESYRGREGAERYFGQWDDAFEYLRVIGEEFRDLGHMVLVVSRIEVRGRGSGAPVTARQTAIYDLRDGKVSRIRGFLDHGEALRAAGLSE